MQFFTLNVFCNHSFLIFHTPESDPSKKMAFLSPTTLSNVKGSDELSQSRAVQCTTNRPSMKTHVSSAPSRLRKILSTPGLITMPCCFDALSASLIERAGFPMTFMSGFSVAASKKMPDTGLLTYSEMVERAREITEVTTIPMIVDGDTGYGNAINLWRTVKGFALAGAGGIMVEDQVSPKRCGHVKGKDVVGRDEAILRIKAACEARDAVGNDMVIVARTDAAGVVGMDEAIERANRFQEIGADVVFVEAPKGREEMKRIAEEVKGMKLINMLEGGTTPILSREELEALGYKIAAYPLTLISSAIRAMEDALEALKTGSPESVDSLLKTFEETKAIAGFPEYHKLEERYELSRAVNKASSAAAR